MSASWASGADAAIASARQSGQREFAANSQRWRPAASGTPTTPAPKSPLARSLATLGPRPRAEAREGRGRRRRLALQRRWLSGAGRAGDRNARPGARSYAGRGPVRYHQPGELRGSARVNEMLEDGVVAEVIYSPQRTMRHFVLGSR